MVWLDYPRVLNMCRSPGQGPDHLRKSCRLSPEADTAFEEPGLLFIINACRLDFLPLVRLFDLWIASLVAELVGAEGFSMRLRPGVWGTLAAGDVFVGGCVSVRVVISRTVTAEHAEHLIELTLIRDASSASRSFLVRFAFRSFSIVHDQPRTILVPQLTQHVPVVAALSVPSTRPLRTEPRCAEMDGDVICRVSDALSKK